jgi:hypothetical protein
VDCGRALANANKRTHSCGEVDNQISPIIASTTGTVYVELIRFCFCKTETCREIKTRKPP